MSHTYIKVLSKKYYRYTIDIFIADLSDHGDSNNNINLAALEAEIDSLPDKVLSPRQLTDHLLMWSDKILKVDIRNHALSIILSTEIDPKIE